MMNSLRASICTYSSVLKSIHPYVDCRQSDRELHDVFSVTDIRPEIDSLLVITGAGCYNQGWASGFEYIEKSQCPKILVQLPSYDRMPIRQCLPESFRDL